jgi:hypothetical protein
MRRVTIIVGAVVVVAAAVGAFVLWPRGATPVAHDDAVEQFRSQSTTTDPDADAGSDRSTPAAGAYRYAAEGDETVKFAVLPAETRTLAESVSGVVVDVATPGSASGRCFELTMHLFAEHVEHTVICADDSSVSLGGHTKEQTIGALSPVATLSCAKGVLLDPSEDATTPVSHPLECSMTVDGGPAAITVDLAGTSTQSAPTNRQVGGESVEAVPVELTFTASGGLTGTWVERWWLSTEDWLPVEMERALDLQGPASFVERSSFVLEDLVPTT